MNPEFEIQRQLLMKHNFITFDITIYMWCRTLYRERQKIRGIIKYLCMLNRCTQA